MEDGEHVGFIAFFVGILLVYILHRKYDLEERLEYLLSSEGF